MLIDDPWHLYVLRAGDGSLYTGISKDVDRRLAEHAASTAKSAKYLRGRGPLELAFRQEIGSHALALKVEHRVKRLARRDKERIVKSRPSTGRLLNMLAIRDTDRE